MGGIYTNGSMDMSTASITTNVQKLTFLVRTTKTLNNYCLEEKKESDGKDW